MAIYRTIQMSFWTDPKVVDDFTPEDKYFYLYIMTNPHTNLAGCYEISYKQMSDETGYSKDTVARLLKRLEEVHEVIKYSPKTKELLIVNWSSYNWTKSKDFLTALFKNIESVKSLDFRAFLEEKVDGLGTVSTQSKDGGGTTVTVTNIDTKDIDTIKDIIGYLNNKANKKFRYTSKSTQEKIKARLNEGYTVDDFKKVIDTKCDAWLNNKKMNEFLRPETLFAPSHFESYLNETPVQSKDAHQFV